MGLINKITSVCNVAVDGRNNPVCFVEKSEVKSRIRHNAFSGAWLLTIGMLLFFSINKYPANPNKPDCNKEHKLLEAIEVSQPININTAKEEDLIKLKGVGKKRAKQIITYRRQHGNFQNIKDLQKVPGISDKFIKENTDIIVFRSGFKYE